MLELKSQFKLNAGVFTGLVYQLAILHMCRELIPTFRILSLEYKLESLHFNDNRYIVW